MATIASNLSFNNALISKADKLLKPFGWVWIILTPANFFSLISSVGISTDVESPIATETVFPLLSIATLISLSINDETLDIVSIILNEQTSSLGVLALYKDSNSSSADFLIPSILP